MKSTIDPKDILNSSPMNSVQLSIIGIMVFLNALDGFDVLSISFASPGIASAWGINRAELGIVLSMELIGMAIGSIFLGRFADQYGRRPMLLGCLVVMSTGMLLATTASNSFELSIWRIYTGFGIGGMLASTNAATAEFSSNKHRNLCISLMVIGYPLGGVFGGMVASNLLEQHQWQSIFYFGGAITCLMIPVVYFMVPESIQWLATKQPVNALERINNSLHQLRRHTINSFPDTTAATDNQHTNNTSSIFSPKLLKITTLLCTAYFFHITTFYFILKWTPKIVADMGFNPSLAGSVLVWANIGGALGGAIFGLVSMKLGLKRTTISVLILSAIGVSVFGHTPNSIERISMLAAFAGFFTNAGVTGLYAIIAIAFPTNMRATGTGFVIGVGRGAAVLSPIAAGYLFESGENLPVVAMVMGAGSIVAATALFFLKLKADKPTTNLP